MDSQQQQASERLRQANNILVTVSSNPSVDQLAACIGLTISLNKLGKHATAVFSGGVPSTLEFLQPEKTIEKNTDSLRDFIIALDKSKADKLRYKVEDRVVKIFITPYRTSISDKDLEFSQGDFNVDVIVALGVHNQEELDLAITSHGRILHDATVITLNTQPGGELGSINWLGPNASSLSELAVQLVNSLDKTLVDGQVATAFLTGIVSETERFSNNKTTPQTMSISAQLMSSGANQQLVATKLEEPVVPPPSAAPSVPIATQTPDEHADEPAPVKKTSDGTLEIAHDETKTAQDEEAAEDAADVAKVVPKPPEPEEPEEELHMPLPPAPQIHIDEHGSLTPAEELEKQEEAAAEDLLPPVTHDEPSISRHSEAPKMILEPPTLGGELTASGSPRSYNDDDDANAGNAGGLPKEEDDRPPHLDGDVPSVGPTIMPPTNDDDDINAPGTNFLGDQPLEEPRHRDDHDNRIDVEDEAGKTLTDIEHDVHSSHVADNAPSGDNLSTANPLDHPEFDLADSAPAALTPPPAPSAPEPADPIISAFHPPTNDTMLPPVSSAQPVMTSANADMSAPDLLSVPDMPTPGNAPSSALSPSVNVDSARDAVAQAMGQASGQTPEPIQALNAQNVDLPMGGAAAPQAAPADNYSAGAGPTPAQVPVQPWTPTPEPTMQQPSFGQAAPQYGTMPPAPAFAPQGAPQPYGTPYQDPSAPPSVPPPMLPPTPR